MRKLLKLNYKNHDIRKVFFFFKIGKARLKLASNSTLSVIICVRILITVAKKIITTQIRINGKDWVAKIAGMPIYINKLAILDIH